MQIQGAPGNGLLCLLVSSVYEVSNSDAEAMLSASANAQAAHAQPSRHVSHAEAGGPVMAGAEAGALGAQTVGHQGTVRIRGLPFDSTEEDIRNFFSGMLQ